MKTYELKKFIKDLEPDTPLLIWGPPGIGKSEIPLQVAKERSIETGEPWRYVDFRLLLMSDPSDLKGLPYIKEGKVKFAPLEIFPTEGQGYLVLEEISAAPPIVQAASYQLVLERRVGELQLGPGWRILATTNRYEDGALVHQIPTPLRNRFISIELEADLDSWKKWARKNEVREEIIGFLNWEPASLLLVEQEDRSFATPRSYYFLSKVWEKIKESPSRNEVIQGTIGKRAGAQFITFLDIIQKLPPIEEILDGKKNIPQKRDEMYAVISAACSRFADRPRRWAKKLLNLALRLDEEWSIRIANEIIAINSEEVMRCQELFSRLCEKNEHLILGKEN